MTDSLVVDSNSNNQVNPGDVIRYKTTINVAGAKAGNVNYTLPLPSYTSGIVGSIKSSALAQIGFFCSPVCRVSSDNVLTNDFGLPSLAVTSFGTVALPNANTRAVQVFQWWRATQPFRPMAIFYLQPCGQLQGLILPGTMLVQVFITPILVDLKMRVGEPAMGVNDSYNVLGNVSIKPRLPGPMTAEMQ